MKMLYVKMYLSDVLEGVEGLTFEQAGFYLLSLFKMYARMDGLPFEEKAGALMMRCDVRTYRRLRDILIAAGKFEVDGAVIRNHRVEREIESYCDEIKRRQAAARDREEKKRAGFESGSAEELHRTSGRLPAEFAEKSGTLFGDFPENEGKKTNKNNEIGAEAGHSGGTIVGIDIDRLKERDMPTEEVGVSVDLDKSRARREYSPEFEKFWALYPVKDGKWAAFDKSWRKLDRESRSQAIEAAPLYAARIVSERIERPKWAQGWLTERRFEDELRRRAGSSASSRPWWTNREKVASLAPGDWVRLIRKHANGVWPIDKLGYPPGHEDCIVPRVVLDELGVMGKYDRKGAAINGGWHP